MRLTETSRVTGANADELHYLEQKGFISVQKRPVRVRSVREYAAKDLPVIALAVKHHREGLRWDVAWTRAQAEVQSPPLLPIEENS